MRSLLTLAFLGSLGSAQTDGGDCTYAVELMFLQDASTSFDPWVQLMQQEVKELMANFSLTYAEFKMGVASFVDKPMPLLGVGAYGNKPWVAEDYCYWLQSRLSGDPDALEEAFVNMYWSMGSGGDLPEAPFDGMAYAVADSRVGWSTEAFSEGGRPIVRVVLLVTDYISHMPGDADSAIHQGWEYPRAWLNESYSTGGFGATSFYKQSGAFQPGPAQNAEDYMAMAQLFYKYDTETITEDEAASLKGYVDKLGPYPWPRLLDNPNDGVDRSLCDATEYIAPEALGALMREKQIVPIFVVVPSPGYANDVKNLCRELGMTADVNCVRKYYENQIEAMGVQGVATTMQMADLREKIIEAVNSVTEMKCQTPSTTTAEPSSVDETIPPVEATSSSEEMSGDETIPPHGETTSSKETTIPPAEAFSSSEASNNSSPTSSEGPDMSTACSSDGGGTCVGATTTELPSVGDKTDSAVATDRPETTTSLGEGVQASTTYTTTPVVVPPPVVAPPSGGGPSTGVIAGAAGGSVAALAALGGILYRKFGAALFGGSSPGPTDVSAQVEVPESPVERETMEAVTMDMFQ